MTNPFKFISRKIQTWRARAAEKRFSVAFETMKAEFYRRGRERQDELIASRGRLVTSAQYSKAVNPYLQRLNGYKPYLKNLQDDYVDCLKSILIPNCEAISASQQLRILSAAQTYILGAMENAIRTEETHARASGRPKDVKSYVLPVKSLFTRQNSRARALIESTISQTNLFKATHMRTERKKGTISFMIDFVKKLIFGAAA